MFAHKVMKVKHASGGWHGLNSLGKGGSFIGDKITLVIIIIFVGELSYLLASGLKINADNEVSIFVEGRMCPAAFTLAQGISVGNCF